MPDMTPRRAFLVFAIMILMVTISDRLIFIILPLHLISLDFSATEIGIIFSVGGLFLALFRFLIGKLSDIKGRKRILSLSLLTDSVSTAFYPFVSSIGQFSAIKGAKDISENIGSTMEDSLIGDSFPRADRPRALARLGTLFPLSRATAAVIGFLIVTFLSVTYGFYAASASLFIGFLVFTMFYKEGARKRITSYRFSVRNLSKPLILVTIIGTTNAIGHTMAYSPGFFILADGIGLGESDLFLMFLATYFISSLFAWRTESWMKRHGKAAVLGAGAFGYGLFTMFYSLSTSPLTFYLPLLGVAISFYVYRIGYKTLLLDSTDDRHRGEQVGFSKMTVSIGNIIGPVTGGLLIDLFSLQTAFIAAGLVGISGLFFSLFLRGTN
jgi:MFS transporter, DHA1 family, multidrug resistance protein